MPILIYMPKIIPLKCNFKVTKKKKKGNSAVIYEQCVPQLWQICKHAKERAMFGLVLLPVYYIHFCRYSLHLKIFLQNRKFLI